MRPFSFCSLIVTVCCTLASARIVDAQETIHFASVSGRVSDPQGAVVSGAQVSARQTETNVTAETVTDSEGRFRFPYLKVGPYEVTVHVQGLQDNTRTLSLTVGSAFDIPIALSVAGLDADVTVKGEAPVLETARSQIAGTVPQTEVQSLPMNGRNFLDLALLIPGVSPTNIGSTQLFAETSAVPGKASPSPASATCRTASSSTACRRTMMRRGSAESRTAWTPSSSFRSSRQEGRPSSAARSADTSTSSRRAARTRCTAPSTTSSATTTSTRRTRCPGRRCRWTSSSSAASLGGPLVRNRTFYFSNFEQRLLDQTGLVTILPEQCARSSTPGCGGWLSRVPGQHRHLSESCSQRQLSGETRSSCQRIGPV